MPAGHAVAQDLDERAADGKAEIGRHEGVKIALLGVVAGVSDNKGIDIALSDAGPREGFERHFRSKLVLKH